MSSKKLGDNDSRVLFSQDGVYTEETISLSSPVTPTTYAEFLLKIRLDLVRRYASGAKVLDLACATGQHLIGLSDVVAHGVGIDFSQPYVRRAEQTKQARNLNNLNFICSDAGRLPFHNSYYDFAYSFSSLYIIPSVADAISEIGRVLRKGGKCTLDLGNKYSLNTTVSQAYAKDKGWATTFPISVPAMKRYIHAAGLRIIEHRAFQILPLWGADRPRWLYLFLLPFWTYVMSKVVRDKMLDEWVSNLFILKYFAFRHIFTCEKI